MTELVLAIDAGTTGIRSMFFDQSGNVIARAYSEFKSSYPHPSWVEQKSESWWEKACATIKQCLKEGSISLEHIIGISVTNQRETVVPVDENGKSLRTAIVWQDRRTIPQCNEVKQKIPPAQVYSITGLTIDPYFTAPKILWIREKEKAHYDSTAKFLLVHDYLVFKLSGEYITDYSNASRTLLFDIREGDWSKTMLELLDIPIEKLPKAVPSGIKIGELTATAAKETGIKEGTPIISGGGDQQCAALGVGVAKEGMIKSTTGTGTFMLAHSKMVRLDPSMRVLCSRHVVPDAFVVEASMFTTGSALKWYRDNLGREEVNIADERGCDPYDILTDAAMKSPPGAGGVIHIPHFVGAGAPHWNPHARGVFAGLALGHTRHHLIRSILEGVSYDIRSNMEVMRELGLPSQEMRVTGGAARSEAWMQIQADVVRVPVIRTKMEEATAVGAAILAFKGVDVFKSVVQAAEEMVKTLPPLNPRKETLEVYSKRYKIFKELYAALAPIRWDED